MKPPPPPENALQVPTPGELRDRAIERVGAAHRTWKEKAVRVGEKLAKDMPFFTTDDLWAALARERLDVPERRAMGAVMQCLAKKNVIRNGKRYVPSKRPDCHSRPILVWDSQVY